MDALGVSITTLEPSEKKPSQKGDDSPALNLAAKTELAQEMSDEQAVRFLDTVTREFRKYHTDLHQWRGKMKIWEQYSEGDYSARVGTPDPHSPKLIPDIFSQHNDSLGVAEGFADFADAQTRDDIFGSRPWLAATPEAYRDPALANIITKHADWKLGYSDLEPAILDAIKIACWGGTCFLKSRWVKNIETYKVKKQASYSVETGQAHMNTQGKLVHTAEELEAMQVDGNDVEWREQLVEETKVVYENTRTDVLDYKDVAFSTTATRLDLELTSFYTRVRMPILDAIAYYKISPEQKADLDRLINIYNDEPRQNRGEQSDYTLSDELFTANRPISLVEGFVRADPMETGSPIRIHCVFSPEYNVLFSINYLAIETPEGKLPVFPVRIGKIPRRILGRGYFEKYERANDSVDRKHNLVAKRDKLSASVIAGVHKSALADEGDTEIVLDPERPIELKDGMKLADFIEFSAYPDLNTRTVELLNQQLQMMQMNSGITSAAQGELKGVPNASTATGVNQMISRGALLLKAPISQATKDIEALVAYNVDLIYANQNREETFSWGEGEASELLTIVPGDIQGLRMKVSLKLTQSQNQSKLANAQAAIAIIQSYIALPETDKVAARPLFVQAIESLSFNNAEDLVRQAVVDPAGILALMPPEAAPAVQEALIQAGLMAPVAENPQQASAPVPQAA